MLKKEAKSLSELIASKGGDLGRLADAAQLRTDLGDYLRKELGPELGSAVSHCNIKDDGTLSVTTTTPEWASRLRFEASQILRLCKKRGLEVHTVKVRVGA